jgi:hypothetical protein
MAGGTTGSRRYDGRLFRARMQSRAGRHRDGGYALRWSWTDRAATARQPALKEEGKDE